MTIDEREEIKNEGEKSETPTKFISLWKSILRFLQRRSVRITIFTILNLVLLYFLIDWLIRIEAFQSITELTLNIILIYSAIFIGLMIIKSVRYQLLLFEKLSPVKSFFGISIGFLINSVIPARIGDISRIIYLKKSEPKIKAGEYLGALIIEKFVDMISLVLIVIILSLISAAFILSEILWILLIIGILTLLIVGFIVLIVKYHTKFDALLTRFISSFNQKMETDVQLSEDVYIYFKSLVKAKWKVIYNIVISFIIVFVDTYLIYLIIDFFMPDVLFYQGILVGCIGFLAVVFPILPGGLGTYEGGIALTLGLFGHFESKAFSSSFIEHILRTLIYIILGLPIYLFVLIKGNIKGKDITLKSSDPQS